MIKTFVSTALLTLSLFEQASALDALKESVDVATELDGIEDYHETVMPLEFPLTEEDTIKMQNRYADELFMS